MIGRDGSQGPVSLTYGALERSVGVTRELRGDGRGWVLTFVSLGWLFTFGIRFVYPALLPTFDSALGVDLVTGGMLLSVIWFAYALGQIPGGFLADRIGERNILVLGVGVAILGLTGVVLVPTMAVLFAGSAGVGLGAGLFATTRFTVLSDLYTKRDGAAHGLVAAMGNVGSTVLPVTATILTGYFTWQVGLGFSLPFLCLIAFGLLLTVPQRTSEPVASRDRSVRDTVRRIAAAIANRRTVLAAFLMLLMASIFQSFTSIYPTYLVESKAMSESTAAGVLGVFFAAGIVMQLVAGIVSDRVGAANTTLVIFLVTTLGLICLPFASSLGPVLLFSVLLSACSGFWPTIHAYIIPTLPSSEQGSCLGAIRTGYLLLAAAGPTVMGIVSTHRSFELALTILATLAVIGIVTSYYLPPGPSR